MSNCDLTSVWNASRAISAGPMTDTVGWGGFDFLRSGASISELKRRVDL